MLFTLMFGHQWVRKSKGKKDKDFNDLLLIDLVDKANEEAIVHLSSRI